MKVIDDVHHQFAEYFAADDLKPYLYLLSKKSSEGHICLDIDNIDKKELAAAGYKDIISKKKLSELTLISDGNEVSPFVLFNNRLYLQRYYNYETIIYDRIVDLISKEGEKSDSRITELKNQEKLIKDLFNDSKQNNIWQLAAAVSAVMNNFTIITGGPGTGKTTTVAKILSLLFTIKDNLRVALAAPTGKAAARMKESLKEATKSTEEKVKKKFETLDPSTIHRLLGNKKIGSIFFHHNRENPLDYDVVIIDESSMIDVAMFAKLLDAIGPDTRLIMLGDKDQLASVEAGSIFGDLCQAQDKLNLFSKAKSGLINSFIQDPSQQISKEHIEAKPASPLFEHVIELLGSHRFSDTKGIGKFSKAILNNSETDIKEFFGNADDQVKIDTGYSKILFNEFIAGYEAFIKEKDISKALKKLNNLRVLCAIREGEHGLYAINRKIEAFLQQKKLIRLTGFFYNNRPIIVTSNNYELNLFNGDIGIIRPDENGALKAWFEAPDGKVRHFLPGYISDCETVYAMTIHKSQGSEFDKVLVVLPSGDDIQIMTSELLYTAVTRARTNVTVQGSHELILKTAGLKVQRGSGIIDRFNQK